MKFAYPGKSRLCLAVCISFGLELSGCGGGDGTTSATSETGQSVTLAAVRTKTLSADDAVDSVFTTGFVDVDGAKMQAVAIKYKMELKGANIDLSTFQVSDYAVGQSTQLGANPGAPLGAYIDDEPFDTDGKTGSGNYVVIPVNTNYQLAAVPLYKAAMAASIKQVAPFTTAAGTPFTVTASSTAFTNYTVVSSVDNRGNIVLTNTAIPQQFNITNIKSFKRFANDTADVLGFTPDGLAFHATSCFDEADGLLHDVDLPYSLYVPADYDATKKYMLVVHVGDAGALGTDPNITLTESKGPVNYASPEVQQIAKDQGYAGLIVVAPQVPTPLRTTRDNYSTSAAVPATWQLLDYLTAKYNVDSDRIYGSGQSMGALQMLAMAAQRDNYFAAIWPIASQWGNNFSLQVPYAGAAYYQSNDATIWKKDAHGNDVNYRNLYYMISDDNILIDDCLGDSFSSSIWGEAAALYRDITNGAVDIKANQYVKFNPLTVSLDDQNATVRSAIPTSPTAPPADFGMFWEAYDGGSHTLTWVYAHRIFSNYQWLLTKTRQSEMNRRKLDLNKPVVYAAVQLHDANHLIFANQTNYYKTFAVGSGTDGYNTTFENPQGAIVRQPGWTAADFGY